MEDRFSSTFFIRKSRSKKSNKCDIYLRITANGKRSEISINRKIDEDKWNKRASRVMGRNVDSDMINAYMDMITSKYKLFSEYSSYLVRCHIIFDYLN